MATGDKYTIIRTKRKELIGIIQRDPESILDESLAQSIITEEEYDSVNQLQDKVARIRKLLIYIQKRGESTCRDFLECLEILFPGTNRLLQPSEYDFFNPERDSRPVRDPEPRERDFFNPEHHTELKDEDGFNPEIQQDPESEEKDGFNPEQESETQRDPEPEEKDGFNPEQESETQRDPEPEEKDGLNPEPDPQLEEEDGSNPEKESDIEPDPETGGSDLEQESETRQDQEPEEEDGSNPEQELETEPDPEPEGSNSEQELDSQ